MKFIIFNIIAVFLLVFILNTVSFAAGPVDPQQTNSDSTKNSGPIIPSKYATKESETTNCLSDSCNKNATPAPLNGVTNAVKDQVGSNSQNYDGIQ
jgi:hypothetical protein